MQQPLSVLALFAFRAPGTRFGQQLLELAGGGVQWAVMVVDKADGAGGDELLQVQQHQHTADHQGRTQPHPQKRNPQNTKHKQI